MVFRITGGRAATKPIMMMVHGLRPKITRNSRMAIAEDVPVMALYLSTRTAIFDKTVFGDWYYTPQAGALYSNHTSINTTAKGAEAHLSDFNKQFFAEAYPADALDKLWWWPIQEPWYVSIRNEYQDRFLAA